MKQADLKAQKPSGEEATVSEVFLIVAPATPIEEPARPARTLVALVTPAPAELPKTASPLPLLELAGLLLLAAGLALRATSLSTR